MKLGVGLSADPFSSPFLIMVCVFLELVFHRI
uniref:Uncharacterized protein n=1 Tax=Siphoviridae sp. ctEIp38 TaxID=2825394 RepID=A0A8S5QEA0_9CAUD|nr:MAG TPA: hypothetical protein [Siphoviridae sp. ctEIp38]